ncbi:MAG: hypothetical protein HXX08_20400 [Chloroflexi bacterium]|uniref:Uncharacterized protein n=1 Tax=Candidatus Chlorohelix allophototropha TaxID=3003348 RepID=A0A8T7M888_9CHLR|nr:hypothetical protein [Chloroflexota bacterium]WJW68159.1 hypothetical protein OZ401_003763 [Chloroflexota bacterium L227-S17]
MQWIQGPAGGTGLTNEMVEALIKALQNGAPSATAAMQKLGFVVNGLARVSENTALGILRSWASRGHLGAQRALWVLVETTPFQKWLLRWGLGKLVFEGATKIAIKVGGKLIAVGVLSWVMLAWTVWDIYHFIKPSSNGNDLALTAIAVITNTPAFTETETTTQSVETKTPSITKAPTTTAVTPTVAATTVKCPSPVTVNKLCPWSPKDAGSQPCGEGFCWDGGFNGSLACKQESSVPNSGRTYTTDLVCNEGYEAVRNPCTNVITSCTKKATLSGNAVIAYSNNSLHKASPGNLFDLTGLLLKQKVGQESSSSRPTCAS